MSESEPVSRIDRIEQKVDTLSASVDKQFVEVREHFVEQREYIEFAYATALDKRMTEGFARLDQRITESEQRMTEGSPGWRPRSISWLKRGRGRDRGTTSRAPTETPALTCRSRSEPGHRQSRRRPSPRKASASHTSPSTVTISTGSKDVRRKAAATSSSDDGLMAGSRTSRHRSSTSGHASTSTGAAPTSCRGASSTPRTFPISGSIASTRTAPTNSPRR